MTPQAKDPSSKKERPQRRNKVTIFLGLALIAGCFVAARFLQSSDDATQLNLPVSKNGETKQPVPKDEVESATLSLPDRISQEAIDQADHPFDPLLQIGNACIEKIDAEILDYSATLTSQVRINGVLQEPRTIFCKIRHPKDSPDDKCTFSVYTKFVEPDASAGQEAIWVDGWHEGNLVAHITGVANLKRFYLDPNSRLAMNGTLHPIDAIGFRNLLVNMCKVGEQDRKYDECIVTVTKDLQLNGRNCTMFEAKHPVKRDHFEFHIARLYIDNELEIPMAYEGYMWPEEEGGEPVLLERYHYSNVQINIGLEDIDFDPANETYDYPAF
ncbi:MAG: DUF1571 domain-containing protein [Planctomycetota bacterium]